MTWAVISTTDNSWVSGPHDDEPTPGDGQRIVQVVFGYPDSVAWSPAHNGFVDLVIAQPLISVGRFQLLFTQAERLAIRAAAGSSAEIEDYLELLKGFTDGVSLSDPFMIASVDALATAGLITTDRAAQILAGASPA